MLRHSDPRLSVRGRRGGGRAAGDGAGLQLPEHPAPADLPLVFPAAALLLVAGASEEEACEVMMVAPPPAQNISYFTQTRGGWDVLCSH